MSGHISIASWNVNGLRAIYRKGFMDVVRQHQFDIICLQEIKARPDQLPSQLLNLKGYQAYFFAGQRPGYSGVAVYSRIKPESAGYGFGIQRFDDEGRVLWLDFGSFILFNTYMPNGGRDKVRLDYKLDFYYSFLDHLKQGWGKHKGLIVTGDINTAHQPIDLARPRQNKNNTGFLPQEREWIDRLLDSGFVDTFRLFCSEAGHYSWWDYKTRARERNVGWRLDYFFATKNLQPRVKDSYIMPQVTGSDHCPVVLKLGI
ncbi:MAG: exodeoxyribonuclease III [Actinomycetota bacterium]|nr:exodeoxyribonuclease III [Actinomycetota bacterium]